MTKSNLAINAGHSPVVAIIGVGLIGGSLGLAIRNRGLAREVLGIDCCESTLARALEFGAIDRGSTSLECVGDAQLVILATPVRTTVSLLKKIVPYLAPGILLTDVGSTKVEVVSNAQKILPDYAVFIGGHPMAGSERAGIGGADPYLFENAFYVITPEEYTPVQEMRKLLALVEGLGARPVIMSPGEHDRAVAAVSHLPHLLAASLVNFLFDLPGGGKISPLAAGGFRDTTRIAAGNPEMWRDIFLSNRKIILETLHSYRAAIDDFSRAIGNGDAESIYELLDRARRLKITMPARTRGYLPVLWEILVTVPDRPGMIAEIAGILGRSNINITDIEIMRVREGEGGTIRIGLATEEEQVGAVAILRSAGYQVLKRQ